MHIKHVTALTGLSAKQIRDYEKQGLLNTIHRSDSGYRNFGNTQIKRLQFIKHAREVGFSLAQIKELLLMQDNQHRSNAEVKALTHQHIETLTQKIEQLQAMKATLQQWHDNCSGDGSAQCSILDGLMAGHACHTVNPHH